jgi:hypothetical protein
MTSPPKLSPEQGAALARLLRSRFFSRTDHLAALMPWNDPHPIEGGEHLDALLLAHVLGDAAPSAVARYHNRKGALKLEKGHYRLGSYAPDGEGNTVWFCLDFDGPGHAEPLADPQAAVVQAWRNAAGLGMPAYIEQSGSGKGWHLWVFFAQPVSARDARRLALLVAPAGLPLANGGEASARGNRGIEVFPKQEKHRKKKGLGNLVWLPLWAGAPEGANQFYRLDGDALQPYLPDDLAAIPADQVAALLGRAEPADDTEDPGSAGDTPPTESKGGRATVDDLAVEEFLRRVDPNDKMSPPTNEWAQWAATALAAFPLESVYGDLLLDERSGDHWWRARDPDSDSGSDSRSGSVADGQGEARRGTFHSFRTGETLSLFDFLVRRGLAADFKDALRKVAELSGVPLPSSRPKPRTQEAAPSGPRYPVIVVNGRQLRDILWDTWQVVHAANAIEPTLFRRSGRLVRLVPLAGMPLIEFVDDTAAYGIIARLTDWVKRTEDGDSDVMPPHDVARDVVATPDRDLPPLDSVVTAPVFDHAGKLASEPGYHREAALWYHQPAAFSLPPVPDAPTFEDVEQAKALLLHELLVDFPFVSDADRAHVVAALLLPFIRALIPGPTPVHLFEAPMPGSGKTLLAEVVYLVATGEKADPTTLGRDDEETRKKITSVLALGRPVVLIDNVRAGIDSANLAAALTAETWQDRLLGQNKMVHIPNRAVWLVTANNPDLSLEIARRSIRIRIEPPNDRPWQRDQFKHSPLKPWVLEHRGELVWALLVLVRAWISDGSPAGLRTLGSFEPWAAVVGGILETAGISGFLSNCEELYEAADVEGQEIREFVVAWWEAYDSTPVPAGQLLKLAQDKELLPAILGSKSERSQAVRLGKALKANRSRHYHEYKIETSWANHSKQNLWRLVRTTEPDPPASRGDVLDLFPPREVPRDVESERGMSRDVENLTSRAANPGVEPDSERRGRLRDVLRTYAGVIPREKEPDPDAPRACTPDHAHGPRKTSRYIPQTPETEAAQGSAPREVNFQHPAEGPQPPAPHPAHPAESPSATAGSPAADPVDLADLDPEEDA